MDILTEPWPGEYRDMAHLRRNLVAMARGTIPYAQIWVMALEHFKKYCSHTMQTNLLRLYAQW